MPRSLVGGFDGCVDALRYVDSPAVVALLVVGLAMAAVVVGEIAAPVRMRALPRWVLVVGLALAAGVVLVLTMPGGAVGPNTGGVNLVPGRTVLTQLRNLDGAFVLANLTGNVGVFVPVGFFAAALFPGRTGRVAFAVLLLAVGVEASQAAGGRTSDVDDVVLNALGGWVGAVLVALARRLGARRTMIRP